MLASLDFWADIKLIKNNARVGSQIAVELAKLHSGHSGRKRQTVRKGNSSRQPVVIGGSILDSTAKVTSPVLEVSLSFFVQHTRSLQSLPLLVVDTTVIPYTVSAVEYFRRACGIFCALQREGTNAGSLLQTMGGVGRNIAECMSRLGAPPFFITALGRDFNGQTISHHLTQLGMVSILPYKF